MRLRFAVVLSVLCVSVALSLAAEDLESKPSNLHEEPPVKLDKTLRRALLKALSDLEAESAEQHAKEDSEELLMDEASPKSFDVAEKNLDFGKSTFSFSNFPNDDETVSEDKLQNSTFIEIEKFVSSDSPVTLRTVVDKSKDYLKNFQTIDSISTEKSSATYKTKQDQVGPRSVKSSSPSSTNAIKTATSKSTTQFTETLIRSESNGIAAANALVSPKPTASSPTVLPPVTSTSSTSPNPNVEEDAEDVKIFQAPLVAAFTVQQDERGIPKSVVPIYRPSGDGQALSLQEQLDFKQKLLEKQLVELQQQQLQQTQFLLRQQHAYEEQLRQKQQQEIFFQDHARLKQLQDQARLKQLEDQRQKHFEEQIRQKQLEKQRHHQQGLQQQHEHIQQQFQQQQIQQLQQQQQHLPIKQNNMLSFKQSFKSNNIRLQPSTSLEVPHDTPSTPFQTQFQDQLRTQQLRQQQQQQFQQQQLQQQKQLQQQQHLQQHELQQQLQQNQHQQKLQQSFALFSSDLQPPVTSATRFNRQEAFGSVGNFGFNVDTRSPTRNTFSFNTIQQRSPQSVVYNQFPQFPQSRPPPSTPAKQIQHLLYQSGIANELQSGPQGFPGSQEDLNIVSKVLALNVGAVPLSNNLQFAGSQRVSAYVKAPSVA